MSAERASNICNISIPELLSRLSGDGVKVELSEGSLRLSHDSRAIDQDLIELVRKRKQEVIEYLLSDSPEGSPAGSDDSLVATTSAQRRYWVLSSGPGSATYSIVVGYMIRGKVDLDLWEKSTHSVMARYDAFSIRFHRSGVSLYQYHSDNDPPPCERGWLKCEPEVLLDKFAETEFQVEGGELVSHGVFASRNEEFAVYVFACHHIIMDGESLKHFLNEVVDTYLGLSSSSNDHDEAIAHTGFLTCVRRRLAHCKTEGSIDFWVEHIGSRPWEVHWPIVDEPSGNDGVLRRRVPEGTWFAVKRFAKKNNISPFSVLYAAFRVLIYRVFGCGSVPILLPVANREDSDHNVIGCFANVVPIRIEVDGEGCFLDVAHATHNACIISLDYQDAPLEIVARRLRSGFEGANDLLEFPLLFAPQTSNTLDVGELVIEPIARTPKSAKLPLSLIADVRDEELLTLNWEYSGSHLGRKAVERVGEWFERLLDSALEGPSTPIRHLELEGNSERDWEYQTRQCIDIVSRFREVSSRYEANVAIEICHNQATYGELDSASDVVASKLVSVGIEPGDYVGISIGAGIPRVIAILGILKTAAAYVPLPIEEGQERCSQLARSVGLTAFIDGVGVAIDGIARHDIQELMAGEGSEILPSRESSSVAYVNFSSGTTGNRKAIACRDAGVVRLVTQQSFESFDERFTILSTAPFDFDAFTFEIWAPLLNGGRCVLLDESVLTPDQLRSAISKNNVNSLWLTTALFNTLVDLDVLAFRGLSLLVVGGDVVSPSHVARLQSHHPEIKIVNGYGPTENTTFTTCYVIPDGWDPSKRIPIGYPIEGTEVYVVGPMLESCPDGVIGEIVTTGMGLAKEYIGMPELTREAFPTALIGGIEQRCYRTGDYGYFDSDGLLNYLGRRDHQVKVNGYRIELTAVDNLLRRFEGVHDAATVALSSGGSQKIISFIVAPKVPTDDVEKLERDIFQALPVYHRPHGIKRIDAIPLSDNGKADRKRLTRLAYRELEQIASSRNQRKEGLARGAGDRLGIKSLVEEAIGVSLTGEDISFLKFGASSLDVIRLVHLLKERMKVQVSVSEIYANPTLSALQKLIEGGANTPSIVHGGLAGIVDAFYDICTRQSVPAAQCAVSKKGGVLSMHFGLPPSSEGVRPTHLGFRVGCNLKILTLLVTLKLVEEGRLSLNAFMSDVYPGCAGLPAWEGVTLEHLLSHTHGLDFPSSSGVSALGIAALADSYAKVATRLFKAGSMYGYSMIGHCVVAATCEYVAGEAYEALLEKIVVRPLGINLKIRDGNIVSGLYVSGQIDGNPMPSSAIPAHTPALLPSGSQGVYISAEDLLQVGRCLLPVGSGGIGLLDDETIRDVFRERVRIENHPILLSAGLSVFELDTGLWGHLGDGAGQHCSLQIDPISGCGIACTVGAYPSGPLFSETANSVLGSDAFVGNHSEQKPASKNDPRGVYESLVATVIVYSDEWGLHIEVCEKHPNRFLGSGGHFQIIEVDEERSIYRLSKSQGMVRGSVTFFENDQGAFMRIGQALFKKVRDQ